MTPFSNMAARDRLTSAATTSLIPRWSSAASCGPMPALATLPFSISRRTRMRAPIVRGGRVKLPFSTKDAALAAMSRPTQASAESTS